MNIVNLELAALVLSLLCLIYSLTANRRQYHLSKGIKSNLLSQHFVFLVMLVTTIFSSASSVGGARLQAIASERVLFWQYQLHAYYFFFHITLSVSFALYIMNVTGASIGRSRRFYVLFSLPYLASEILVLTNRFTGFVFYMDEQFLYHRGSLIVLIYAAGFAYILLGFLFFFRYKKAISRANSQAIAVLITLSALGIVIQGVRSEVMVELFSESLAFLGMMIMLEERIGHIDPVTGALNRVALVDASRRLIETDQSCRIVLVKLTDLELFSRLFHGREMDNLLMQVSAWLTSISSEQRLYNYRSRDFAILYPDKADEEAAAGADAILKRFEQEWKTGEATLRLEAAVSIIRVPEDVSTLDELTELLTVEHLKTGMGSRLVPFDELSAYQRDRRIEQLLREAVDEKLLRVWYQPIWSAESRRTVAAEALLRIDSGPLRELSSEVYIPIAEQCGVIREIGLFVFEEVCRFLQNERLDAMGLAYVELNLSVHQFMYDNLAERFEAIRARYGIPAQKLNLEITESASTGETPIAEQTMNALRAIGYTFSLDDFGTGYSNLVQLISSSYKNVKMDKSLLWDSAHNKTVARLLDSLTRVIRSLGYNVVQEGVETLAQLEQTERSGGNLIQGYYFSPPLPEDEFIAYLEDEARRSMRPPELT